MRKRLHLVFTLLIVFALTGCNGAQLMRKSPSTETVEAGEDVMDTALIGMVCSAFLQTHWLRRFFGCLESVIFPRIRA